MPVYKCTCEFYVKADDESGVLEALAEDSEFLENHLIVDEVAEKSVPKEEIYDDVSSE